MTLYLKYRPQTFADVVGQDHVVTTLERAVERGQLSHAYLLSGTRGTGKTSVARILAKVILVSGTEDEKLQKQLIKGVEDGSLVDLIEIDAASNRRIDDVRELIERINFSPVVAKAKIYIIDEVHMLTKEAFNALLKTLEEPPPYAYFILATTELAKVPDTIQSRCQRFLFKHVRDDDLVRRLQYICDQEHIKADREALRAIARSATGSFRDAISLLDQLRSLEKITAADVAERTGTPQGAFVEEMLAALRARDQVALSVILKRMEEMHASVDAIANELLSLVHQDMHATLANKQSIAEHMQIIEGLLTALREARHSPVPALALEAALLGLCMDDRANSAEIPQSPRLHVAVKHESPTPVVAAAITTAQTPKAALIEAPDFSLDAVRKHWPDVLRQVTPPSVRMSLKNATVSDIDGLTVLLSFASVFHRDRVAEVSANRGVEDILSQLFKRSIRLECALEQDGMSATAEPEMDLVEAAAEVFGRD